MVSFMIIMAVLDIEGAAPTRVISAQKTMSVIQTKKRMTPYFRVPLVNSILLWRPKRMTRRVPKRVKIMGPKVSFSSTCPKVRTWKRKVVRKSAG